MKTSLIQKVFMLLFSVMLTLVLIELSLRVAGFACLVFVPHNDPVVAESDGDPYVILALGESTTADIFKCCESWPRQLERILNNRSAEKRFRVINVARGSITTAKVLQEIRDNLDAFKPDLVVSMMGVNDRTHVLLKYEGSLKTNSMLAMQDFRLYKLAVWLYLSWLNRFSEGKTYSFISPPRPGNDACLIDDKIVRSLYGPAQEGLSSDNWSMPRGMKDQLYDFHIALAAEYANQGRFSSARRILTNALNINDTARYAYYEFARTQDLESNPGYMPNWSLDFTQYAPNCVDFHHLAAEIMLNQGVSAGEVEDYLHNHGLSLVVPRTDSKENITAYHYRMLHQILNERGIRYVAMQYPTLSVDPVRRILDDEDVMLVSNEANFNSALINCSYDDLFIDRFAGTFGHATTEGNRLIAENLAGVILKGLG
ncbi:MAG: SGNH/GDSL hydrolase family protein [archaeon]